MYEITEGNAGWHCSCQIQDGTETWLSSTKTEAIQSLIRAARVMNGTYITEKDIDIRFHVETTSAIPLLSPKEVALIQDIDRGAKVVLDFTDPRIKYKITPEDCELIVKIREGEVRVLV